MIEDIILGVTIRIAARNPGGMIDRDTLLMKLSEIRQYLAPEYHKEFDNVLATTIWNFDKMNGVYDN